MRGRRIAGALRQAAGRGVHCRALTGAYAERAGVEVKALRGARSLRQAARRIDLCNHRELAVVDGCVGYVGSQNLHDPTLQSRRGERREMTLRLQGPVV